MPALRSSSLRTSSRKRGRLERVARVAARLARALAAMSSSVGIPTSPDDVLRPGIARRRRRRVADELARASSADVVRDPLDERVALGVDGARVERVRAPRGCARSPRTARTPSGPRPGHVEQRPCASGTRRARRGARRSSWRAIRPDARHVGEERRARRVELDADARSRSSRRPRRASRARSGWWTSCWYCPTPIAFGSIFTSSASGSCRRRAIEIGAAHGEVEVGELLARDVARRVHARAGLADEDDERLGPGGLHDLASKSRRLAPMGPVPHGDREGCVLRQQRPQRLAGRAQCAIA